MDALLLRIDFVAPLILISLAIFMAGFTKEEQGSEQDERAEDSP